LIESVVPDVPKGVEKATINKLAKRLAKAEFAARSGRGKLVPEAAVAQAFNDLMSGIGAPLTWHADEAAIRKFRARAAALHAVPVLLTADRNGTNCSPGEAIFLLQLLISNRCCQSSENVDF
jgi:hypothetical protein